MKISGIGVDLIKNSRMEKIIQGKTCKRFLNKVLNVKEIEEFNDKKNIQQQTNYLASRWSFKEAMVKATGRRDLIFPHMFLNKNSEGKPYVEIIDQTSKIVYEELKIMNIHVSISHEDEHSIAFIILERKSE